MAIPEWDEIAIPNGFGPHRLLYNPPSQTVIAELRSVGEQLLPNQIHVRKKDAPKYEPIKTFQETESCESAVTSLGRPMLFYLSNSLEKVDEHYTGNWIGLYSFDLESRENCKIADESSLKLPPPYVEGWITNLVDASADATELYVTVAMTPPDTSSGFQMVNYVLARMDLTTCEILPISHLRGAFF